MHIYIYIHTYIHIYIYICIYIYIYMYTCIRVYMYTCIHRDVLKCVFPFLRTARRRWRPKAPWRRPRTLISFTIIKESKEVIQKRIKRKRKNNN